MSKAGRFMPAEANEEYVRYKPLTIVLLRIDHVGRQMIGGQMCVAPRHAFGLPVCEFL